MTAEFLKNYNSDFYGMAKNLKFKKEIKLSEFQKEMKSDLNEMNKLDKVIIAAAKSPGNYQRPKYIAKNRILVRFIYTYWNSFSLPFLFLNYYSS